MLDVSELFSAVALYAFQRLLVLSVGATEGLRLQLSFQSVMALGIKRGKALSGSSLWKM